MKPENPIEKEQERFMRHCLALAEKALEAGNPPVGSVIVYQNKIIGEGIESGKTTNDITDHAEILAVRDAIKKGHKTLLKESTMYSTHEPCIMCSYVIRHHAIPEIVLGVPVENIGGYTSKFPVLKTDHVPNWKIIPQVVFGICETVCEDLNSRFQKKKK